MAEVETKLMDGDLRGVFETIWSVTLGLDLLDPAGSIPPPPQETLCACVHLTGAWDGLVSVSLSEALARRAASAMFDQPAATLAEADLHDAIGEIANMTGGGIKAMLPTPTQLSLPAVVSGNFSLTSPGGAVVNDVAFQCGGSQIRLRVISAGEPKTIAERRARND